VRKGVRDRTHKEVVALAGEACREWVGKFEADPGPADILEMIRDLHDRLLSEEWPLAVERVGNRSALEQWFGTTADSILSAHALEIDQNSRDRLLTEICRAVNDALDRLIRHAGGQLRARPQRAPLPKA